MGKEVSDKLDPDTILICANEDWEGPAKERLKQRGEQDGVKGNYRVCPECGSKDFNVKSQTYLCRTFSVAEEISDAIRKYSEVYGLPGENTF